VKLERKKNVGELAENQEKKKTHTPKHETRSSRWRFEKKSSTVKEKKWKGQIT